MPNLSEVPLGTPFRIAKLSGDEELRCRLFELGLFEGAEVVVEGRAWLGGPIRIRIQQAHFAIRKKDAQAIEVSPL